MALEELRRVSRYDRVKAHLNSFEVGRLINGLRRHAVVVKTLPKVTSSPDPDANPILAIVIGGDAQYLVTGDKRDLLSLKKFKTIPILRGRSFVEQLEGNTSQEANHKRTQAKGKPRKTTKPKTHSRG